MTLVPLTEKFSSLKASFKDKGIKALEVAVGSSIVRIVIPYFPRTYPSSLLTGNCASYLSVCTVMNCS